MPVRRSRYYNNPAIGAAFSNLAQMFAPPSAAEAAGWQRHAQIKERRERETAGLQAIADIYGPGAAAAAGALGAAGFGHFPKVDLYNRSLGAEDPRSLDSSVYAVHGNAGNTFAGLDDKQAAEAELAKAQQEADLDKALAVEAAKPKSKDQVLAEALQEQIERDPAFGPSLAMTEVNGQGLVEIVKDGQTVLVPKAVAHGGTPPAKTYPQQSVNYRTADGQTGNARFDPASGKHFRRLPDGSEEELPPDAIIGSIEDKADAFKGTTANETAYNVQTMAIAEQSARLDELENLVGDAPQVAGLSGAVLGTAQDIAQTLRDMKTYVLATGSENDLVSAEQVDAIAAQLSTDGDYDPSYARFNSLILRLAYGQARLENPSGEVSRYALERQLSQLNPGLFANSGSLNAMITQARRDLQIKRESLQHLNGGAEAQKSTPPSAPPAGAGPILRFERNANGQLVPVQ